MKKLSWIMPLQSIIHDNASIIHFIKVVLFQN